MPFCQAESSSAEYNLKTMFEKGQWDLIARVTVIGPLGFESIVPLVILQAAIPTWD